MKPKQGQRERRVFPLDTIEVRDAAADGSPLISGHAAVFNQPSHDMGGWHEQVDPDAFKRTLRNSPDLFSFFNHDPMHVLGRTKSGTLSVSTDLTGLRFEVQPPETSWADDLLTSIKRGDISGASFLFQTMRDRWEKQDDGTQLRTLLEVRLFELGPVTMPAYPQTDVGARSALAEAGIDPDELDAILARRSAGTPLTAADLDLVRGTIRTLTEILPTDSPRAGHSDADDGNGDPPRDEESRGHSLLLVQRTLLVAEAAL